MKKVITSFAVVLFLSLTFNSNSFSQQASFSTGSNFNTTLEYCTGTWCQWCPCGHDIINAIKITYPNLVVLGYHGAGSDPWQSYSAGIRALMGFSAYPTGVIGRRSGIQSRGVWGNQVAIQQSTVSPEIKIDADVSYNSGTRSVSVNADLTALTDVNGTYRVNFILLESGMVYPQTGNGSCPGSGTYIHNHVVKGMINGDLGAEISTGSWIQNSIKNISIQHTLAGDVVPENADIAVIVWKQDGSLTTTSHVANAIYFPVDNPTNITGQGTTVPVEYKLSQNFPNPFNPTTSIVFSVPISGNVSLKFYDALGNEVANYVDGYIDAGTYNAHFDGANLPSGVYFYTLKAENFAETKKMMLLK